MKDTLENRKLVKKFSIFVSLWLKTGFEWFQQKPEVLTGWRFGHDWNNDYFNKLYKGELPKLSIPLKDAISETVCALIASGKLEEAGVLRITGWLEQGISISKPPGIYDDPFLKHMVWALFHQLQQVEELIEK